MKGIRDAITTIKQTNSNWKSGSPCIVTYKQTDFPTQNPPKEREQTKNLVNNNIYFKIISAV